MARMKRRNAMHNEQLREITRTNAAGLQGTPVRDRLILPADL